MHVYTFRFKSCNSDGPLLVLLSIKKERICNTFPFSLGCDFTVSLHLEFSSLECLSDFVYVNYSWITCLVCLFAFLVIVEEFVFKIDVLWQRSGSNEFGKEE